MTQTAWKAADNLDAALAQRIATLRAEQGETVALDDIASVVESLVTTLGGDISAIDARVQHEVRALVDYIAKAKQELAALQPAQIPHHDIPVATDELDAVVRHTETATNAILECAENLGALASATGGDVGERINAITTRIYEASNFQDITGQRITKVVRALRHIEDKVIALAGAFGEKIEPSRPPADKREGEAALLNGPQLPQTANSQDDIDALLAGM
jgi:chemotaxis protein CheZ